MSVQSNSRQWAILTLVGVGLGLSIAGCGPARVPVNTQVGFMGVRELPLDVAIVSPDSVRKSSKTDSDFCLGKYEVPLGNEIEKATTQALSQAFRTVDLVRDKSSAVGQYDLLIEIDSPELAVESHCAGAIAAACTFSFLGAALAKQSVDAQVGLHVAVSDKNGQKLLTRQYKSGTHSKTFGGLGEPAPNLGRAVGDAIADLVQEIARSLASSSKIRLYAKTLKDKSEHVVLREEEHSEEDDIPRTTSGHYDDAYALVVGIAQYQHANQGGLTNLVYADDDAEAFFKMLKKHGWPDSRIRLLINKQATKRNIGIALESWLTKAGSDDLIVLFWSGHGFHDPEDPERVYFACYDTEIGIPPTGYRMDKVRGALEERRIRNVIVFADTCHAGKLISRGEKGISIVPQIEKMRREQTIPKGWIFMVGADTDRLALENSSWSNGAFTHCLLKGLGGEADGYESVGPKDNIVTMGELRAYLNTAMPDETQKVLGIAKRPVITTSTGDPHIWDLHLQAK